MAIAAKLLSRISSSRENSETTLTKPLLNHNEISFQQKPKNPLLCCNNNTKTSRQSHHTSPCTDSQARFYPSPSPQYQPDRTPPLFEEAINHRIAHRVNNHNGIFKAGDPVCESTGMALNKESLKLDCERSAFFHLGPVIPMYFQFVKQITFFLFLLGIIAVFSLLKQGLPDQTIFTVMVPTLILTLLLGLIIHLFRRKQKLTKLACKKTVITPSDYTVMCSNLGRIHVEEEVRKFFSDFIVPGYSLDVYKVVVTYNIGRYVQEIRKLHKVQEENKIPEETFPRSTYETPGSDHVKSQTQATNNFFNENKRKLEHCFGLKRNGLCFVTFNTKQEAKTVRRKFEMSKLESLSVQLLQAMAEDHHQFFFKQHFVTVEKAPELNEIIWENLNCNETHRVFDATWMCSILGIIIFTCILAYSFQILKISIEPYLIGIIIAIMNEIIAYLVSFFAFRERFKTITKMKIEMGKRLIVAQFMNMVLPIFFSHSFGLTTTTFNQLSNDIFIIAFITFAIPLFVRFINPLYLIKEHKRKQLLTQGDHCKLTQEQLNSVFEDPDLDISSLYADILRILLFSCTFFIFCPSIAILGFVTGVLTYWVEKYNLLNKTLLPTNMRSEIAEAMFEFIDWAVFLLPFSCYGLFYLKFLDDKQNQMMMFYNGVLFISSFIVLLLASIYASLPNKRLNRVWFPKKKLPVLTWIDELFYQQAQELFPESYESANPVFRDKPVPENIREIYSSAYEKFISLEVVQDIPELLPLFDYAIKRPSLQEVWKKDLQGLRNPFYFFPQNYGYGMLYIDNALAMPLKTVFQKRFSNVISPAKVAAEEGNSRKSEPKHIEIEMENKEVEKIEKIDFEIKLPEHRERIDTETTPPGGSIMREWATFFNQKSKSLIEETAIEMTQSRGTLILVNGGPLGDYERHSCSSFIKSPATESMSAIISPIRKATCGPLIGNANAPFTLN